MPQLTILDNGLRVISKHMKETETVAINICVDVGSRWESEPQNGLSHFLEHMAFKGTKRRTARQIAEEFDSIGGYLNAATGREHTSYYATLLRQDFDVAGDILSDILQHSTFDQAELEKERTVVLQEIAMTQDTPDDIIFDHYQEKAFGNQPLGRSILGTENHVSGFCQDDLNTYVQTHYTPERIVLSVAGNIDHEKVVAFAKKHMTALSPSLTISPLQGTYTGGEYREIKDLEQTHLVMGFQSVSYHDKVNYYPTQLLACVLGGGMSSRLFQEIRENRGLAYSVNAFTSTYHDTGLFTVSSSTAHDRVGELVQTICEELKKAAEKITEEELTRAKTHIKASLLMAQESSSNRAEEMARHLMCYGEHIPLHEIIKRVEAVKTGEVAHMMETILQSPLTLAAIGQLDQLEPYGMIQRRLG